MSIVTDIPQTLDKQTDHFVEWSKEHEDILVDWADKAMCYRWLHSTANQKYAKLSRWFTIPVIIISTLTGTANFAQDRIDPSYLNLFVMVVGSLNIIAGIISTVQQFLKINELNESNRVSSISWDKFYRNIRVELAKNPKERTPVLQMLKFYKEEFDRLMETSPAIGQDVIEKFTTKFQNTDNFDMIKKPEICDSLISTATMKYSAANDPIHNIKYPIDTLIKKKQMISKEKQRIRKFISEFKESQGRQPLMDELVEQFSDSIESKRLDSLINMIMNETADLPDNENTVLPTSNTIPSDIP
jgi:hypothetical protein